MQVRHASGWAEFVDETDGSRSSSDQKNINNLNYQLFAVMLDIVYFNIFNISYFVLAMDVLR